MTKKKLPNSSPLVYSTDPYFKQEEAEEVVTTLPPAEQKLKITIDKKHRAGKVVTLITGFTGNEQAIEQLSKELKSFCGTGGAVKDGVIIIQGDNREKIFQRLFNNGYRKVAKS